MASTLNSTSTLAQVEASYSDNCSYEEDKSAPKCRAFLTACRMLVRMYPKMVANGQQHAHLTPDLIQLEIARAIEWLAINDTTGPGVTRYSFENFRQY